MKPCLSGLSDRHNVKRKVVFASLMLTVLMAGQAMAADQDSMHSDLGLAMKWAREGKYDQAMPVFVRLHKQYPDSLDVTRDYLTALDWSGKPQQAVSLYATLPDDREPDYVLLAAGHSYRALGQTDEAVAVYRKGKQLYPDNGDFAAAEIRLLIDQGKYSDAASESNDALAQSGKSKELNSVVEEARHVYAVSEAREGRYTEALQILAQLHESYPNDPRITRDYLAVQAWSGDDDGAIALYKTLPAGEQPDYVYAAVGKAYRNLRQPDDAAKIYHEALTYYPGNRDFQAGEVNSLIEAGRNDEAANIATASGNAASQESVQQSQDEMKRSLVAAKQNQAADFARNGQYKKALEILRPLARENPNNMSVRYDMIAVLAWSGNSKEAIAAYKQQGKAQLPDFVLLAIGHAYRDRKEFNDALAVYKRGHAQTPANEAFTAGIVGTLIDMNRTQDAQKAAEADLKANGNRVSILVLASDAADANNKVYDSLIYAQRAIAIAPNNEQAKHALVHAEQRIGAADAADETAKKMNARLTQRDIAEIEGDQNASLVRWGKLEPVSEQERYAGSDQAIGTLNAKLSGHDDAHTPEMIRARFDRIVALRDRSRMQEAVTEYEALKAQGVKVPAYVLGPVGDAYLYLRQPEEARDVYLEALKSTPNDFEIRRQLFFAYVECDDYDNAYATVDRLRDEQPVWYYLKGEPERQPNPNRAMADVDAANARLYAGELGDAQERLQPIADAAPYDPHVKEALGTLDLTRGNPRAALQEFRLGTRVQEGSEVYNEAGAALAELDMRDYEKATKDIERLQQQYPENLDVQHVARALEVYNMAEFRMDSFYNLRSTGNVAGGEGYGFNADLYSAPIDYNWRLFAGTGYAHENEPNAEGTVGFSQSRAGIEYRDVNLVAVAAPTYNRYNASNRAGFMGNAEWTFNDYWAAGGEYESLSRDTPLRALNQGITASRYGINAEYRENESREIRFDGNLFTFSDGNSRYEGGMTYSERVFTAPHWRIDALVLPDVTHDTGDSNRLYYNPKTEVNGLVGARATETLYRRYETLWEHSLAITPGVEWEQSHGVRPAWAVSYQHDLHLSDTTELGAGVNYGHHTYDGQQEDNVSFTLNLIERF